VRRLGLAAAERLDVGGEGPEDLAVGRDGAVFTGLRDGRIVRLDPETLRAATFAETGGRPLGLRFAPDGRLLIADAERGLLAAAPDGSVTVLRQRRRSRARRVLSARRGDRLLSCPWLYLGMLKGHAVARVPRPARYSSPMTPKSMEPASR
jgi:hypothetical protein